MAEIIIPLVPEVVKCLAPLTKQLGYLPNYNDNIKKLKESMVDLKNESSSIENRVNDDKSKGKKIEEKVQKWQEKVANLLESATNILENEATADNLPCLKRLFTRYKLSKKAAREEKAIGKLLEAATRFHEVSYRPNYRYLWLKIKRDKDYVAFESRIPALKAIQNALYDDKISIIGVYGMPGVGKTTLVENVARLAEEAEEDKRFDQMVFSEVSRTPDVKKIQREIAEQIGLTLDKETEFARASMLYAQLKKSRKILVILDNVWTELHLKDVGIPFGDEHKGCKVLLTTRGRDLLSRMGSEANFSIEILNEEEAWRLFEVKLGNDDLIPRMKSTATHIVKECGGLPIAIEPIAKALRNKTESECWKNALHELRMPTENNFHRELGKAYTAIKLSYDALKGEQLKKIFQLCSLMPKSFFASDLFKYCIGLGIFRGINMEDARNKLYTLVHELKDSCLLLEGYSCREFSMHDVVHDVAILIACGEQKEFLVRNGDVWEWPDEDALKKCYAISWIDSSGGELPEGLECPQLELLLLSSEHSSVDVNIPQRFFTGMRELKVVDLTNMQLFSLPSSIDLLVNLQTLCLDYSTLGDITIIGKLKNLEILSLIESDIVEFPEELGKLTKLRLLDLTNCFHLKVIAPNVIASFTRLEELYMSNCFVEWKVEDEGSSSKKSKASLDELMPLPRLTTLEIAVENDNALPEGFFVRELERFKILIGDRSFEPPVILSKDWFRISRSHFLILDHQSLRMLKLKLNCKTICSRKLQGIRKVEYLCLDKFQGVKNILFELDTQGFSQLKHLLVQNNPDLLFIVDSREIVDCDAFPLLELLSLQNLINLKRICVDRLSTESFSELRTMKVENCDELSNIFVLSTTKCLPSLQRIAVIKCNKMKEIFAIGGEEPDVVDNNNAIENIEFAQIRYLSLGNLPELKSFCCEVKGPSMSPSLFNGKVVLPNLEALELCEINVKSIWHNQTPSCFQHLTRLIVWGCQKLKFMFYDSMIKSLEQLQHLEIRNCTGLEVIISEEGPGQETPCFAFRRVTNISLCHLPELTCLYPGLHTSEWPELKKLEVFSCDKLYTFASESYSFDSNENNQLHVPKQPLFSFEKIFPNLEELGLNIKDIMMLLQGDFPRDHLFGSLKDLEVRDDDSASVPIGLLEKFHGLENLNLSFCSYKELFSNGGQVHLIKKLELICLNDLEYLWIPNSKMGDSILQNLEILKVDSCQKLMNLVTPSGAKSLVRLESLTIYGCSAMTQVVISEGDAASAKEEIVFIKLKSLDLHHLDSLTSFSSGNYTFRFPSLEYLCVIGCPKMKIFTAGDLRTLTESVCYGYGHGEWRSDSNINKIIHQLHEEKLLEKPSMSEVLYS
ncbi:Disease resistance protein [Citrus sinensis]|uniref:Disease resistance protein n=1 Tax=Citrus sinensis TaxID=2711 RepID=A0ACB8IIU3_CITSI|nr:Disease resistance protein [Citrus sinensis]